MDKGDATRVCIYTTDENENETENSVIRLPSDFFEKVSSGNIWSEKGEDFVFVHIGPLNVQIFKE